MIGLFSETIYALKAICSNSIFAVGIITLTLFQHTSCFWNFLGKSRVQQNISALTVLLFGISYSISIHESVQDSCKIMEIGRCPQGGHSYISEDMDVRQGLSNPYPLQTKISAKFWTLRSQMADNFRKYIS